MENTNELPAVARNINLPCKKCGVDRFFVVLAHTNATSAKVKCEVCGAAKTYKLPKAKVAKAPAGPSKRPVKGAKSAAKKMAEEVAMWTELNHKIGADKAQPYSMKAKYAMASAIQHPKFGVGFVIMVTNEKIEVAFQDCGRSLVHNRP